MCQIGHYHMWITRKKKKKKQKSRKNIFLFFFGLRIAYTLLTHTPDTRFRFTEDHPHLAKAYGHLLELIGNELNLPVKECKHCKIKFLPDPHTKGHQKCCNYGCIELNQKINKKIAKSKYRKTKNGRTLRAEGHDRYRERKRNGQVNGISQLKAINLKEVERKLRNQIKFFYRKLNPEASSEELEQLDDILEKFSQKINTS